MKHKTLWTFLLWAVTLSIFELPLLSLPIGEIIGTSNMAYIVIIDIYVVASLFALLIAKYEVKTIDTLIEISDVKLPVVKELNTMHCPYCKKEIINRRPPDYSEAEVHSCEHCGRKILWEPFWERKDLRD